MTRTTPTATAIRNFDDDIRAPYASMLTEGEVLTQALCSRIFEAMYECTTRQIRIQVEPRFIEAESDPKQNYFYFSYSIRIHNEGTDRVTLLGRHWVITDGFGQTEEVVGDGVVGQQPVLNPGEMFEYSSFCPLATPTGSMQGTYSMVNSQGIKWDVQIPKFILAEPGHYH